MTAALVIDYTPAIASLVGTVLRTINHVDRIDMASRGDIAARMMDAAYYDLIVLDPVVPRGEERLLSWMMRTRPMMCRRTILCTARPIARDLREDIAHAEAFALLDKPFDVDVLAETTGRCIALRSPSGALPSPLEHAVPACR